MGRTACTEHQCLYKGALYLLPLFLKLSVFLVLAYFMHLFACFILYIYLFSFCLYPVLKSSHLYFLSVL